MLMCCIYANVYTHAAAMPMHISIDRLILIFTHRSINSVYTSLRMFTKTFPLQTGPALLQKMLDNKNIIEPLRSF